MKVLLTGACGYIGYPLFLELKDRCDVIGVDNGSRHKWVENVTGKYTTQQFKDGIIFGDLTDRNFVSEILAIHKPDVIIHLASQPSMPYSHINGERALFTQLNNVSMLLNLLWGVKENGLRARFVVSTTTGVPGSSYKLIAEAMLNNSACSWYHVSRGFDSANLSLASRLWDFQCIEFRTSIVYGLQTAKMKELGETTRFDTDEYFGTVMNRFVNQAVNEKPITIYGKGSQTKPFISLEDCVTSLANATDHSFGRGHTILNQVTEMLSPNDIAEILNKLTICFVKHIPNPRKEKENFKMVFENKKFLKVLGKKPEKAYDVIRDMVKHLAASKRLTYQYTYEDLEKKEE